jgi:hypothetical protein
MLVEMDQNNSYIISAAQNYLSFMFYGTTKSRKSIEIAPLIANTGNVPTCHTD